VVPLAQSGRLFDLLITLKLCASLIWLQLCPNMDILCAWSFLVGYNPDNLDTNCCNLLLPPPPPYFAFFSLMQEASCLYLSQCTILCTYIYYHSKNYSLIDSEDVEGQWH
jgi:hypothetical protein